MYLLNYVALTHPGKKRKNNEDNFYVNGIWRKDISNTFVGYKGCDTGGYFLAAVCDGMGGFEKGEVASLIAVESMNRLYGNIEHKRNRMLSEDPMKYIDEVNNQLFAKMRKDNVHMGTTLAALEFSGDLLRSVNLGDSRTYQFHENKLKQLSVDHSVMARLLQQGVISQSEIKKHPLRHQITQYLGISPDEMIVEPEISKKITVTEGDRYLICSDGLTSMVSEQEIASIMHCDNDIKNVAYNLVDQAITAGGTDNVTVVVIEVQKDV